MKPPAQPAYSDFVPKFMRLLFAAGDTVALGRIDAFGNWSESKHTLDGAVALLLTKEDTANLYFRASALAGGSGYGADNCASARALFLDIDYGSAGHKRKSPFKTVDDVVGYLLTMPLRPSVAWHTGHGLQCLYLLKEPCVFPAGGGNAVDFVRYRQAGLGLVKLAMADAAFTPEHAYRVPLTVNSKAHKEAGLPDVRGEVLWLEENRRHTLSEIEAACKGYGIGDLLKEKEADKPAQHPEPDDKVSDYAKLPQDLRLEIETAGAERSDRLFGIVGTMVRLGYGDAFITEAVGHGTDFVEKYGHRAGGLRREVEQCAAKIRGGHYVYGGRSAPPVRVYNVPVQVRLGDCAQLPAALEAKLKGYAQIAGVELLQRVRDASRFHEHLSSTRTSGVIESGCGAGKSVWAISHIAAHAADDNRFVYVTETVEALHRAADTLEKLTQVGVGRVHGFNGPRCKQLCGIERTWKQCLRNDPKSACSACAFTDMCSYFTRDAQERRPILCMTHSGFIRALEDGSNLLKDANIVIDEGLSPFDTWTVTVDELRQLLRWLNAGTHMLGRLFPGTSVAEATALARYAIAGDADTYARRNYVFMDEKQTSALADILAALRSEMRTRPLQAGFGSHSDDPETARDTLAALLNFFRPSVRADATYAYTETKSAGCWQIQCKRSSFSFGTDGNWKCLWMLNASAQLSAFPYPDQMPVYSCPDLKGNSGLVTLHVLRSNPTKAKQDLTLRLGRVPMAYGQYMRGHKRVLVCADKASDKVEAIEAQVKQICGADSEVTVLSRGRIKGVNVAGDCTLCLLQGLSTFTGIDDCALSACLTYRRTFPDTHVFNEHRRPLWDRDGMRVPAMRNYYALRSLDEIYQAVWRTAVRNDRKVEAVVVVPDPNWLVALYRTVMPEYVLGSAYKEKKGAETVTMPDGSTATQAWDWEWDDGIYGLGVTCMPIDTEITKPDLARALGYRGEDAWEKNKPKIMALVGDFFGEGHNNRWLRRKAGS